MYAVITIGPYARLAQSVERTTLNRVVVGSIPTSGVYFIELNFFLQQV